MALYSEKVMDHFRNPSNVGVIENADIAYDHTQFPDCESCSHCCGHEG